MLEAGMADPRPAQPPARVRIDEMRPGDWPDIRRIFEEGIATGVATFETDAPTWEAWDAHHRPECRLVARLDGEVVGWVALSYYSRRAVYAGVAWESVYVAESARGRGVGLRLLEAVGRAADETGLWTIIAGIQAENEASLAVHERAGFRRLGIQERVGRDGSGRWRDVVLMERRSSVVGQDSE
jgi:phosphinothricin acetyltransferase